MAWTVLRTVTDYTDYVTAADHNETKANFDIIGGADGATKTGNWYVSGNVGIGTTSPGDKLTITGGRFRLNTDAAYNAPIIMSNDTGVSDNLIIKMYSPQGVNSYAPWYIRAGLAGVDGAAFAIQTGTAANIGSETVSTKLFINTAGNVGIGTTSPSATLHVVAPNTSDIEARFTGGNTQGIAIQNGTLWEYRVAADNGEIAINYAGYNTGTSYFRNFQVYNGKYGSIAFFQGSTGRLGIGTTSPGYQLTLSTDSAAKPTSNTWTISSDARMKTVIGPYTRGVADIMALEPKMYRLNGAFGSVDDGRVHVSVIAQETQATWPEMIGTYEHADKDEDGVETVTELLNLNTNELQWAMVNAIKELVQRVEALEA